MFIITNNERNSKGKQVFCIFPNESNFDEEKNEIIMIIPQIKHKYIMEIE